MEYQSLGHTSRLTAAKLIRPSRSENLHRGVALLKNIDSEF